MDVERRGELENFELYRDWHKLVVAEAGFSMLSMYAGENAGISVETIRAFADQVNHRDEAGTLHPRAPVSAVPRRYFRDVTPADYQRYVPGLTRQLRDFTEALKEIGATRIVVDFRVGEGRVPVAYLEAVEAVIPTYAPEQVTHLVLIE